MRLLAAFAFLMTAVCAQAPQIKVEAQHNTVTVTNLYTSPVTALIAWAPLDEPRTFHKFMVVDDPVAFEPDGARVSIVSGERRPLHIDGRDGISVGVLFADGKSAGDPQAVQKLIDHRRETALAISSALASIRPLAQGGESRSALIARVEQLWEQRRKAAGFAPGANVAALVSKRIADLLKTSDDPQKVVAVLEQWRARVEGN